MRFIAYCLKDEFVDYSQPIFIQDCKDPDKLALRYIAQFLRSGELGADPFMFKDKYVYRIGEYDSDTGELVSTSQECIYSISELFVEVCKDSKYFKYATEENKEEIEETDDEVCETL